MDSTGTKIDSQSHAHLDQEDQEWEQIEGNFTKPAVLHGRMKDEDWAGIIGFFHPFWYVAYQMIGDLANAIKAMQVEEEKGCCGQLYVPHKIDGQMP